MCICVMRFIIRIASYSYGSQEAPWSATYMLETQRMLMMQFKGFRTGESMVSIPVCV
jgi:hypothetical protein